ncbi:MAG: class I SAM-dependent methyltransferase [Acidobacteria bacterium]|nr:class I SAM-dependent methyltransferase [Acidobacteriota bacterium]
MKWHTTRSPDGCSRSTEEYDFGPQTQSGLARRLFGAIEGRRVLELGSGAGNSAVVMSSAGAQVIAVEPDADQIAEARTLFERHNVRVEQHQSDFADLAFLRADGFDLVVSSHELSRVGDLDRVFRQVNRVLRPEASLVFSLPHPMMLATALEVPYRTALVAEGRYLHCIGDVCSGLTRANFRLDTVLETAGDVPATLVIRARKQGV